MKSKFVFILFTFFSAGFIVPLPANANPIVDKEPKIQWPGCQELKQFAEMNRIDDFDFMAFAHRQFKFNLQTSCEDEKLEIRRHYQRTLFRQREDKKLEKLLAKQNDEEENNLKCLIDKQIEKVEKWIEMPGKMNEMQGKLNEMHAKLNEAEQWKVLALVFIGITAVLLIFIAGAGSYYCYIFGRNKNLRIELAN